MVCIVFGLGRQSRKEGRLEAWLNPDQKKLIARAAAMRGTSITEFVVSSAQEAAKQAIMDHEFLSLQDKARNVFVNAVLSSPEPNEAARRAAKLYKQPMGL